MSSFTFLEDATAEITILRSVFKAFACHIESEEEAAEKLAALRKKYYDATHVCYAYVSDVQGNVFKFSDDGEPSGTAGAPILSVLTGGGYKQTLIAVVRYFGGTKLGVGGLVKAYTDAANAAVENAEKRTATLCDIYTAETDYNTFKKLSNAAARGNGIISDVRYSDKVGFALAVREGSGLLAELINVSGGKVEFIQRGKKYEIC